MFLLTTYDDSVSTHHGLDLVLIQYSIYVMYDNDIGIAMRIATDAPEVVPLRAGLALNVRTLVQIGSGACSKALIM